jgi:hypothetical protein
MMEVPLLLVLAVVLPGTWLASEFQTRRWVRIVLGVCSMGVMLLIAVVVGTLERLNYNAWYGPVSLELVETTIAEIEAGRAESLLPPLSKLRDDFRPTYKTRANYDGLVRRFVNEVKQPQ